MNNEHENPGITTGGRMVYDVDAQGNQTGERAILADRASRSRAASEPSEVARLVEKAKLWISQVAIAAHRRSPAQTKVAVEALEAFIDRLACKAWQPISTAPKELQPILLWLPPVGGWLAGPWRGSWSYADETWTLHTPLLAADGRAICLTENPEPTHWMPLPPAPDRGLRIAEKGGRVVIAVGFALVALVLFTAWLVDTCDLRAPGWLEWVAGSAFLLGSASLFCGLTYWLWTIAP